MPGSLFSGDESPPDADAAPADDLAPPTPEQSPAAGPLQQQAQQQLWAGDTTIGRAPTDAALEEAIWHRQAAEAEHRHRVAVSSLIVGTTDTRGSKRTSLNTPTDTPDSHRMYLRSAAPPMSYWHGG